MTVFPIYRDQGVTSPAVAAKLLVGGQPLALASMSSVSLVVGGTVGSGVSATVVSFALAATYQVASGASQGYVFAPLDPSGLASIGSAWCCASAARLVAEFRAVGSDGQRYSWPSRESIPFIVRAKAGS